VLALAVVGREPTGLTSNATRTGGVGLGTTATQNTLGGTGSCSDSSRLARLADAVHVGEETDVAQLAAGQRGIGLATRRALDARQRRQAVGDGARRADAARGTVGRVVTGSARLATAHIGAGREARCAGVATRALVVGHLAIGARAAWLTDVGAMTTVACEAIVAQSSGLALGRIVLVHGVTVVGRACRADRLGPPTSSTTGEDRTLVAAHEAHVVELEERRTGKVVSVDQRPTEPDGQLVVIARNQIGHQQLVQDVGDDMALVAGVQHLLVVVRRHRVDLDPVDAGHGCRVGYGTGSDGVREHTSQCSWRSCVEH
jgi:putative intracellular protease/amidase